MSGKVAVLAVGGARKAGAAGASRADPVRERIREAIRSGRYGPGERIRESEGAAARLAARHIDNCEIECLEILLERAEAAAENPEALTAINRQLHEIIHSAAHNRYLTQTLEQLRNALALLRGTAFALPGRAEAAAVEHRAIVKAIRDRDPDAAKAAARAHVAAAQQARVRLLLEETEP